MNLFKVRPSSTVLNNLLGLLICLLLTGTIVSLLTNEPMYRLYINPYLATGIIYLTMLVKFILRYLKYRKEYLLHRRR